MSGLPRGLFVSWGGWPAMVMVLSQWEAARLSQMKVPLSGTLLTLAGTLAVYGADRFLERHFVENPAPRHEGNGLLDVIMPGLILVIAVLGMVTANMNVLLWTLFLGLIGAAYLMMTIGLIPVPPGLKEGVGAGCFTLLTWGLLHWEPLWLIGFFLMALANFIWSGCQDLERDRLNQATSAALVSPRLMPWVARGFALAAGALLFQALPVFSLFFVVALLHGFWPWEKISIDWAFLPLLLVLIPIW